ncbi:MAG TPA: glycosyltransferase 87 family protein [Aggregatilineales bacterium]|nr:glycosyltransferase 87 family protein [Aggregatilineales bacterium]
MPPLLRDNRLLIATFLGLRIMLLIAYQPVDQARPGVTTWGDFQHYFNLAALSAPTTDHPGGSLPYRDYWYEFPPLFPLLSLATFSLTRQFTGYAVLLGLIMTAFDTANLLLVRRLGARLHGEATGMALGWVYAILAAPLVFAFWTFEPIVACAILLALAALIDRHDARSAMSIALGALTKYVPLVLLACVWRFRPWREALRYTVIALALTAIGVGAMLAFGGPFGLPSLTAQFSKASYESVWALIDQNYKTGNFGPDSDHFDAAKASQLLGNPAVVPWWLRGLVFGALGLWVYAGTRRYDARGIAAFAAITITLFFLWSQGWSPQWLVILIPLILVNFPSRHGVLAILLLSGLSFVEYPLLFSRTGETGGAISGTQIPLFAMLVLARTALLVGLAVALYSQLRTASRDISQP